MELAQALEKYQQTIAASPELSPVTGGTFSGRVFLVWDATKGWDAEKFNVAERFFRWAFGAFERSHKETLVSHLASEKISESQAGQLQKILKVANLFQAVYPASSQASSPQKVEVRASPQMEDVQTCLRNLYGGATLFIDPNNFEASVRQNQQIRDRINLIVSELQDPIDNALVEKLKNLKAEPKDELINELDTLGQDLGLADNFRKADAARDHMMQLSKQVKDPKISAALVVIARDVLNIRDFASLEQAMDLKNDSELENALDGILKKHEEGGLDPQYLRELINSKIARREEAEKNVRDSKVEKLKDLLKQFASQSPNLGRVPPRIDFLEVYVERSKPPTEILDRIAAVIEKCREPGMTEESICSLLDELGKDLRITNVQDGVTRSLLEAFQMIDAEIKKKTS